MERAKQSPTPVRPEPPSKMQKQTHIKVSQLVVMQGPRPTLPVRAGDDKCHLWIYKVIDQAKALWEDAESIDEPLWQVQIQHDTSDSIAVNLYDKFSKFLLECPGAPDTLDELKQQALIKLVNTGSEDPDSIGSFRRYRHAFYVAGPASSLVNLLYLLDSFWEWVHKDREKMTMIALHPHYGIDIDAAWDEFSWSNYELHPSYRNLTVSPFECYPCTGKRVLTMTVQIEGDVDIVFSGAIWQFRDLFEAEGIELFRDEQNRAFRVLSKPDFEKFPAILPNLLKNAMVRVVVEGAMKPSSRVHAFVTTLKQNPQLVFV
jgi:hypothetical protein